MITELTKELYESKVKVCKLRRKLLAIQNEVYRLKIRENANERRQLKNEIKKLRDELQPQLPF